MSTAKETTVNVISTDNDPIAIRSMCYITLSYDHRVVDGAVAHQFLPVLKETLKNCSEPILRSCRFALCSPP
jgi:pyruvate dehydrogenase E2 component (dihydrolipoamide acetyltransferase)